MTLIELRNAAQELLDDGADEDSPVLQCNWEGHMVPTTPMEHWHEGAKTRILIDREEEPDE